MKKLFIIAISLCISYGYASGDYVIRCDNITPFIDWDVCPSIAYGDNIFLVVAQSELASGAYSVRGQRLNYLSGERLDGWHGFEIEGNAFFSIPDYTAPKVAFDGDSFLVVWADRSGETRGRFIHANGSMGATMTIEGGGRPDMIYAPGQSNYLVVWTQALGGASGVWARTVGKDSPHSLGPINTISGNASDGSLPRIAWGGSYYLVIYRQEFYLRNLLGRKVNTAGQAVGNEFGIVNDDCYSTSEDFFPGYALESCGETVAGRDSFLVVYHKYKTPNKRHLYRKWVYLTAGGQSVGDATEFSGHDGGKIPVNICYCPDDAVFVVIWARNDDYIYEKRVERSSSTLPLELVKKKLDKLNRPDAVCVGSKKFVVWEEEWDTLDGGHNTSWDICGRLQHPLAIDEDTKCKVKNTKCKVYPNPATIGTGIVFSISSLANNTPSADELNAKCCIYDLSGRLVKSFPITERRTPITKVTWDRRDNEGKEVKAGMYFYKLNYGDNEDVGKFVIVGR